MENTSLMLKYRPKDFDEVVGQTPVTSVLRNSIDDGKRASSYLLYGPRGSGKTSLARIIAKCFNCKEGISGSPCNSCPACKSIDDNTNVDVIEIDGASNRGIADVRRIQEFSRFMPSGRCRVFIIDECQQLTKEAFNAFLKTLEEPPDDTFFILCTTDFEALPKTVASRCQKYLLKPIENNIIRSQVGIIGQREDIPISNDIVSIIAKYANGSMRDALTILEQVKYMGKDPTPKDMVQLLGIIPLSITKDILTHVGKKDIGKIFESLNIVNENGEDFKRVTKNLVRQARNMLICKTVENPKRALGIFSDGYINKINEIGELFSTEELLHLLVCLNRSYENMQYGQDLQTTLETTILSYIRNER